MREPDWDALADLQFLLYNRIAGALNEAISSLALSDMPEAQDKPPGYWKDRATGKVLNVLNLFTAWSYLIRYKRGELLPERAVRPFRANDLLRWLAAQLQIAPVPQAPGDPLLRANQETLQEALLLIHSVACAQGSGVQIQVEGNALGVWFRISFTRSKPMPGTLEDLLASFGAHWRAQDTAFELSTARDFVALNGGELMLITSDLHAEFTFFVPGDVKRSERSGRAPLATQPAPEAIAPQDETKPLELAPLYAASSQETVLPMRTTILSAVGTTPAAPAPAVELPAAAPHEHPESADAKIAPAEPGAQESPSALVEAAPDVLPEMPEPVPSEASDSAAAGESERAPAPAGERPAPAGEPAPASPAAAAEPASSAAEPGVAPATSEAPPAGNSASGAPPAL